MQAFMLDHSSSIPVKLQLKAQVKYQILTGMLRPGDQLPPLRDLAAGLGVHLNTVVRALGELEAEGYLYSHQGKGVFVADEFPGQGQGAALRSLLAGVLQSARQFGMPPEEMALSALAHSQLARPPQAATHRILLVGSARTQLRRLQNELEAALPALVVPVLAGELTDRVRPDEFAVVACTLFHEADVRRQLPRAAVTVLADQPARQAFADLRGLAAGTPVTIVARDWLQAARIRQSAELAGLGALHLGLAAGQTAAALAPALAEARAILAPADCTGLVREALGGQSDLPLVVEPAGVPAEALADLLHGLGTPAAAPGVHVRSAWI